MAKLLTKNINDYNHAYSYAIFLLGLRQLSIGELKEKMKRRGYSGDCIDKVLIELVNRRYLNDEDLARVMVRNFKSYKQYGFQMIKVKLIQKRIAKSLIEQVLEEDFTQKEEELVGRRLMIKLAKEKKLDKNKMRARLLSRGFRSEVVSSVLKTFS